MIILRRTLMILAAALAVTGALLGVVAVAAESAPPTVAQGPTTAGAVAPAGLTPAPPRNHHPHGPAGIVGWLAVLKTLIPTTLIIVLVAPAVRRHQVRRAGGRRRSADATRDDRPMIA